MSGEVCVLICDFEISRLVSRVCALCEIARTGNMVLAGFGLAECISIQRYLSALSNTSPSENLVLHTPMNSDMP